MSERERLPMVCACGDERRAALDAKLGDWTLEGLLYQLTGGPSGHVKIVSDMWFGVEVTTERYDTETDEWVTDRCVYVECDRIIDGLMAVYEHLKKE